MYQSTFFKLSAYVAFTGMLANIVVLIIIIIHFNYHSNHILPKLKLFATSILTFGAFICLIFVFILNNALFPSSHKYFMDLTNDNACSWSIQSIQIITTLTLYSLNGMYLSSLSIIKYNTSLISLSIAILIALISIQLFNTFPYIIINATDNNTIKQCIPLYKSDYLPCIQYLFQSFLDFMYLIKLVVKSNIMSNMTNNTRIYTTSLLLISHLINAVFISNSTMEIIITYSFSIICQSIFILCYFDIIIGRGDNNLTVNFYEQNNNYIQNINGTHELFRFNNNEKAKKFAVNHKYINNCNMIYNVLLFMFHSTDGNYLHIFAKMIAEYASTTYSCCVECKKQFGFIECYKDYLYNCGVIALFDENDNVRYYVNTEPSSWSDCRKNDTLDEKIEILCVKCGEKWKCVICQQQALQDNHWEIGECIICKRIICGGCSTYTNPTISDHRICKQCDDKQHNYENVSYNNKDPNKWKFNGAFDSNGN